MRHCKITFGKEAYWFNEDEHWAACLVCIPTNKEATIVWFKGKKKD